jgi:hypothetical protein
MIEELKILQEMFGQLTGLGAWAIGAYFIYKLLIISAWLGGIWMFLASIKWWIKESKLFNDERQYEIGELERKLNNSKVDIEAYKNKADEYKRESEEVKHMYKILKEAKDGRESA